MKLHILSLALVCFLVSAINDKPIIGILTQPNDSKYGSSYISASYVKFIESAGARVVPIFYTSSQTELRNIFSKINGILFTGGDASLNGGAYFNAGNYLYQLALDANDNGDYFPVQGHCLGFEMLNVITSKKFSVLQPLKVVNMSLALNFYSDFRNSRLFQNAPQSVIDTLSKEKVALNNHEWGVSPSTYETEKSLSDFYHPLSWNEDISGKIFISTIESKNYPIYALQWHAEKPLFEWNNWEAINHSEDSVKAMQYLSDFFVSEARKNDHFYDSATEEYESLIYNYIPVYTGHISDSFVQIYYFNETSQTSSKRA